MEVKELLALTDQKMWEAVVGFFLKKKPYFAAMFLKLKSIPRESGTMCIGYVDDRLVMYYNKYLIRYAYALGVEHLAYLAMHELLHAVLLHTITIRNRPDTAVLNIAYDFIVNSAIRKAMRGNIPNGILPCPICHRGSSLHNLVSILEAKSSGDPRKRLELMYSFVGSKPRRTNEFRPCGLCRNTEDIALSSSMIAPTSSEAEALEEAKRRIEMESRQPSSNNPAEDLTEMYDAETAEFLIKALCSPPETDFGEGLSDPEKKSEVEGKLRSLGREAAESGDQVIMELMSSHVPKNRINWRKYLRSAVSQGAKMVEESTRLIRNRRFGYDFPGVIRRPQINIVIGVDTSGSMSDSLLVSIRDCLYALKKGIDIECSVVEFDHQIQTVKKLSEINSIVTGRGGTDLSLIPNWVVKTKQPRGTVVFIFTDGYGATEGAVAESRNYMYHWMLPETGTAEYIRKFHGKKSYVNKFKFEE